MFSRPRCLLLIAILLAPLLVPMTAEPSLAQENRPAPEPPAISDDDEIVELETTLVEVPVVVSMPGGRYVTDLLPQDFSIYEDGRPQEVAFFAAVNEPFNVALMVDTSGSTRDQLDLIKQAASDFLDQLRPQDRVSLISFEEEVRVLTPLTSDRARVRSALARLVPGQYTQVYEAIHTAAVDVLGKVEGRKAAIVFSDGVDTASAIATFDEAITDVDRHQIIVYPIRYNTRPDVEARLGVAPEDDDDLDSAGRPRRVSTERERAEEVRTGLDQAYRVADAFLWDLADRSGGVLHRADRIEDLPTVFAKIADELRHQYLLGYYPVKSDVADSERRISVTVSRSGLVVRSRPGYSKARRTRR